MPSPAQLMLLLLAAALVAVGGVVSFLRQRPGGDAIRLRGNPFIIGGMFCAVTVLVWHSVHRGSWVPIGDNFDALLWLAVIVLAFELYMQRTHPLAALEWSLPPVVVLLLALAGIFGRVEYHPYVGQAWAGVHRVTSYGGAAAFAIAAAGGAMYLLASHRLRNKTPVGSSLGSLERLERLSMVAVTLGFALLTVGLITGVVEMVSSGKRTMMTKVALAVCVWVVYAIVLHAPINPVFRGRRAAVLSVVGFALMIATLLAAQFMPRG